MANYVNFARLLELFKDNVGEVVPYYDGADAQGNVYPESLESLESFARAAEQEAEELGQQLMVKVREAQAARAKVEARQQELEADNTDVEVTV